MSLDDEANIAKLIDMGSFLCSAGVLEAVRVIPARVPIIKARSCIGQFDVDISIANEGSKGSEAAQLVANLLLDYSFLGPLLAVIKQYLRVTGLSEVSNGGVGSLTLVCLITAYLAVSSSHICTLDQWT